MPFNFLNQGQTDDTATKFQPIDTFIDPVSKIRVSNPANLIDTDFEYGLQPTKWETVEIINNTPAFFSKSGDTTISDITGITTNGGTREITVTTAFPHNLDVGIPIRVSGTKSLTADGSYIINATPTPTTFTYLSRANQPTTISIFDLYSSIITGEFFQGSQISISDAEGMTTDGAGPNSTITIKTANKHGFGPKTPFYFLNLNSTISQEFESTNSTSLSFDPTNSATAQNFDGSNTLIQTPVDLSNSATTSQHENSITSTSPTDSTVTISIVADDATNWANLSLGDPLYYDVNVGSGYFQANPRGVVFIKSVDLVDTNNLTATFQVSSVPNDTALPILANMTGYFQIADQARTFAGNNVDPNTQIDISVIQEEEFLFDGANIGYVGEIVGGGDPPTTTAQVVGYTGTNVALFVSSGNLDYYIGAMLQYSTDGTPAAGLTNNATYFVTAFSEGGSPGLYNMSIAEFPGEADINISGGDGAQQFSKIGVSIDKDIIHVKDSNFEEKDMLEYIFPNEGRIVYAADEAKKFFFVETVYDAHNYKLSDALFTPMEATGGDSVQEIELEGRTWNVHTFSTVGTSTFEIQTLGDDGKLDVLIVAGGGGGGGYNGPGGGGGAGGVLYQRNRTISSVGSYTVVVGDGGAGGVSTGQSGAHGSRGQDSSVFGLTAFGGGGGNMAYYQQASQSILDGGSGGGGGNRYAISGNPGNATQTSQDGAAGFGNPGGRGGAYTAGAGYAGGGGGGAGQPGVSGDTSTNRSKGGDGLAFNITGQDVYYAGGGGSNRYNGSFWLSVSGGLGGGGAGGAGNGGTNSRGANGEDGKGGGGGAGWGGGDGGSGVVIIRYIVGVGTGV